jgi:hypothetical protein
MEMVKLDELGYQPSHVEYFIRERNDRAGIVVLVWICD